MRAVDDVLLDLLRDEAAPLVIHDGRAEPTQIDDVDNNTVEYELPYAVFTSNIGDDHSTGNSRRLAGGSTRRSVFFVLLYVGLDRRQAKWAGERMRDVLVDRRLVIPGHRTWLVELEESQRIRRDDDAPRADGLPLYYGIDHYAVSLTRTPIQH